MRTLSLLTGALLSAALLFGQVPPAGKLESPAQSALGVTLDETPEQVVRLLGRPALVAEFGLDFTSWQFRLGELDQHAGGCSAGEYSHQLVFRKSTGKLVSATINFDHERNVDALFPSGETRFYRFPDAGAGGFSVALRRLSGGRALLGMGLSGPGQATGQLLLIRESDLSIFHAWVHRLLQAEARPEL